MKAINVPDNVPAIPPNCAPVPLISPVLFVAAATQASSARVLIVAIFVVRFIFSGSLIDASIV